MIEKYRGYEIEYSETYSTSPMVGRVKYSSALIRRAGESKILKVEETIEEAKRWIERQPKINTAESRRNEGQQQYGTPKTDEERLYQHFGKEKAEQMITELGLDEAIKQLPSRGTGRGQMNEIVDDEAVREGIKVEAEHKDLIVWLKAYLKEHGEFPPDDTIYAQIAVAHLKESPEYYKELAKMENKNGMKEDIIADYKKELESLEFDVKHDPSLLQQGWKEKIEAIKKKIAEVERMNEDGHRKHTPITTQQQADFFGAELGRKESGEKGQTDMSIEELKRHLREWGKKNECPISLPEDRWNEGTKLYGSRENAKSLMDLFLKKSDFKNPGDEGTVGDRTFRLIRKTGRTNPEGDEQWEVEIIKQK